MFNLVKVSVSYRSYILSYGKYEISYAYDDLLKFPSPIGVIFFLMYNIKMLQGHLKNNMFPSPIGVIFFLIYKFKIEKIEDIESFRLLSELYSFLSYTQKNFCLQYFIKLLSCDFLNFKNLYFVLSKIILNFPFLSYRLLFIRKSSTSHFQFLIFLHKFELLHFDLIYRFLLNLLALHIYQSFQ